MGPDGSTGLRAARPCKARPTSTLGSVSSPSAASSPSEWRASRPQRSRSPLGHGKPVVGTCKTKAGRRSALVPAWCNRTAGRRSRAGRTARADPWHAVPSAPLCRELMERRQRLLGAGHAQTLSAVSSLGVLLDAQNKFTEAEPFFREALSGYRRLLGDDHRDTLTATCNMGEPVPEAGKLTEAESFCRQALAGGRRVLGEDHLTTLLPLCELGRVLVQTKRHREAVDLLAPAETAARRGFVGGDAVRLATFLHTLGRAHAGLEQPQEFAAGEAKLLEAHSIFTKLRCASHKDTRECTQTLVSFYEAWHAAEPSPVHERQVAEWKTNLGALGPPLERPSR
ncbi:MAG: tetratricopeptide repeat-containing protein [Planctomycetota bacterium]